ncbi:MAG: TonB-dependent receptor, partial [Proteobacteria bacterium]|nr:TonB-dependent receptor [Pseudomonadota bacterium]
NDDVILRFTANRSLTRPTLSKLAPARSLEPTQQLGSAGNPLLDPFIANQFDIGAEWYFGEEALLAATFFYKDMDSFIIQAEVPVVIQGSELKDAGDNSINGQTFQISQPINGQGGEVTGLELVYQQPFTFLPGPFDGFGVYANYTYSDSDVTAVVNGVSINTRLQGQSKNSFNIIGYFENEIFNVRLAYGWRDDFVKELRQGREVKVYDYGQLDLTAKYNINDNASISFEALNLTNEISGVFDFQEFRPIETNVTGTTYRLGVSLRF